MFQNAVTILCNLLSTTFIAILSRSTLIEIPSIKLAKSNYAANQALSAATFKLQKNTQTVKASRRLNWPTFRQVEQLKQWAAHHKVCHQTVCHHPSVCQLSCSHAIYP